MATEFDLKAYLEARRRLVEAEMEARLVQLPVELVELSRAMHYSLFAGGKRLRPILCLAGAELFGTRPESVLPAAAALEFIHTYSLIHDDLPAMDDDDLRRGRPTSHKVFGEAMAVLAGDALLTEAFVLLTVQARSHDPALVVEVIRRIGQASGAAGMVGGQVADLKAEGRTDLGQADVAFIHARKTGALITASLASGAVLAGASGPDLAAVETYGRKVGAAFQIVDDLLNIEGDAASLGKPVGSDKDRGKATWPAVAGLEASRQEARRLVQEAVQALEPFKERAIALQSLAEYIIKRNK